MFCSHVLLPIFRVHNMLQILSIVAQGYIAFTSLAFIYCGVLSIVAQGYITITSPAFIYCGDKYNQKELQQCMQGSHFGRILIPIINFENQNYRNQIGFRVKSNTQLSLLPLHFNTRNLIVMLKLWHCKMYLQS